MDRDLRFIDMRSAIAEALQTYLELRKDEMSPKARAKVRLAFRQLNHAYDNLIKAEQIANAS